jgi:hypothetical protein
MARLLVEAGAVIDKAVDDGCTPLCMASENGHLDMARLLVEAGADIDKARDTGGTPLFIASQKGHVEAVMPLSEPILKTPPSLPGPRASLHVYPSYTVHPILHYIRQTVLQECRHPEIYEYMSTIYVDNCFSLVIDCDEAKWTRSRVWLQLARLL